MIRGSAISIQQIISMQYIRPKQLESFYEFIYIKLQLMGNSQSQQRIAQIQKDYIKQSKENHPFFGSHFLLINRNQKKLMIFKQMVFRFSTESKQFQAQFEKIERKPFNIIYPAFVIKNDGIEACKNLYEISVYYDLIGKNLIQVLKTQGVFSQSKAWFLLNQISKALQILAQSYRPHWAISPENIYQNEYQNYFIFDSFFVIGQDPQSFLMKKLENGELMSEKMQMMLEKGMNISPTEGFEEDCFCLGHVLLFVLTGIHYRSLPKDHLQRSQAIKAILNEKRGILSQQMIDIITQLAQREPLKRMDNYQLRRLLKEKEAEIIRNEQYDYEKSRKKQEDSNRYKPQPMAHKLQLSKSRSRYNPASLPTSFTPFQNNHMSHQSLKIPTNKHLQVRAVGQDHLIRARQIPFIQHTAIPFKTGPIISNRNTNENHSIRHHTEIVPSDRSNTLTRINSYDRLITKN